MTLIVPLKAFKRGRTSPSDEHRSGYPLELGIAKMV